MLTAVFSNQAKGFNYGFIEYDDPGAAERAMQTLNGRRVHQSVCISSPFNTIKLPVTYALY